MDLKEVELKRSDNIDIKLPETAADFEISPPIKLEAPSFDTIIKDAPSEPKPLLTEEKKQVSLRGLSSVGAPIFKADAIGVRDEKGELQIISKKKSKAQEDGLGELVIQSAKQYLGQIPEEPHMEVSEKTLTLIRQELETLNKQLIQIANAKRKFAKEMQAIDPDTFINPYATSEDCRRYVLSSRFSADKVKEFGRLAKMLEMCEVAHQTKDKRKAYLVKEILYQNEELCQVTDEEFESIVYKS